jgi:RES domain-containing protein
MPSTTSTRAALSLDVRPLSGTCWRVVEAQHHVSTLKLVDTVEEQRLLEALIEDTKPRVPPECRLLHYLLYTPFRYGAAYPTGSRFRRAGMTQGVFYAAEKPETAVAEMAFHRLLFFAESPRTPWPSNAAEYTAFAADYRTRKAIDLMRGRLAARHKAWSHPTDYSACHALADHARIAGVQVIRYRSVRDPKQGMNLALLSCRVTAGARAPADVAHASARPRRRGDLRGAEIHARI